MAKTIPQGYPGRDSPAAEGETMNSDQWIAAIIILGGLLAWGFVCGYWIGRLVERISKKKGA
jgi:hypothetical protein